MRIVTRCTSLEQFITIFRRFVHESSCFIPSLDSRPPGSETAFSIRLADGTPVLRGLCEVIENWKTADNPFKRPGVYIGIKRLTADSAQVFRELQVKPEEGERRRRPKDTIDETAPDIAKGTIPQPIGEPEEPKQGERTKATTDGDALVPQDVSGDLSGVPMTAVITSGSETSRIQVGAAAAATTERAAEPLATIKMPRMSVPDIKPIAKPAPKLPPITVPAKLAVKPEPAKVEAEPAQVEAVEPAKVEAVEPAKVEAVEPAKVEAVEPAKVEVVEPAKVEAVEPAKVEAVEPAKVEAVEPAKVEAVEPAKVEAVEPAKVKAVESAKAEAAVEPTSAKPTDELAKAEAAVEPAKAEAPVAPAKATKSAPKSKPSPTPTVETPPLQMQYEVETRAPGSGWVLPANPLTALSDDKLEAFIDCTLYEETEDTSIAEVLSLPKDGALGMGAAPKRSEKDKDTAPVPQDGTPVADSKSLASQLAATSAPVKGREQIATLLGVAPLVAPKVEPPVVVPSQTPKPFRATAPKVEVAAEAAAPAALPPAAAAPVEAAIPARSNVKPALIAAGIAIAVTIVILLASSSGKKAPAPTPAPTTTGAANPADEPPTPPPTPPPAVVQEQVEPADEPSVPADKAPAKVESGCKLVVSTTPPGAWVRVDSDYKGKSPVTVDGPCKRRKIEVAANGYETQIKRIVVKSDETVEFALVAKKPEKPTTTKPATPPSTKPATTPAPKPTKPAKGTVDI